VTRQLEQREFYKNRVDKLLERRTDYSTQWVTDKFGPGRSKNIQGKCVLSPLAPKVSVVRRVLRRLLNKCLSNFSNAIQRDVLSARLVRKVTAAESAPLSKQFVQMQN
jgi:hypothetical protein